MELGPDTTPVNSRGGLISSIECEVHMDATLLERNCDCDLASWHKILFALLTRRLADFPYGRRLHAYRRIIVQWMDSTAWWEGDFPRNAPPVVRRVMRSEELLADKLEERPWVPCITCSTHTHFRRANMFSLCADCCVLIVKSPRRFYVRFNRPNPNVL